MRGQGQPPTRGCARDGVEPEIVELVKLSKTKLIDWATQYFAPNGDISVASTRPTRVGVCVQRAKHQTPRGQAIAWQLAEIGVQTYRFFCENQGGFTNLLLPTVTSASAWRGNLKIYQQS